jgi:hypothetical protein
MALTLADVEAADNTVSDLVVHSDDARAKWHSIRPWHPRLSLSVAEITSVSATFVVSSLSSSIRRHHDGFDTDDDIPTLNTDTLSKGVSVTVNGTPWRKCLARLADDADEATIIIHGLMPGRHYDIELGIIPGDEKLKGQIVTESESTCLVYLSHSYSSIAGDHTSSDLDSSSGIPPVGAFPSTASSSSTVDRSPSPPSTSPPPTPSGGGPSYSSQTFEDYLASLQVTLSHLQAEHETLSSNLKSARRDSQRAQAAQRAEITSLKRTAQKHSSGDTRMKQKVRALEEAVKQAIKGREDVEAEYAVLDAARTEQSAELADAMRRFEEARARAEDSRARREKAEEEANNKLHGARAELAAVEARLEKLRAKRETREGRAGVEGGEEAEEQGGESREGPSRRGEGEDGLDAPGGLVGELETKLREMLLERERIEADPYGQSTFSHGTDEAATAAGDKTSSAAADSSAQGHAHAPNHGRNASHSHSHAHAHANTAARNKRPGPLFSHHHSPSHSHQHAHSHSHSHSYSHSLSTRPAAPPATSSFSPPASAPVVSRAAAAPTSSLPRNHAARGALSPVPGYGVSAYLL